MIPPSRITLCLDAGDVSGAAVRYARTLAERLGARLHVLYMVPKPLDSDWTAEMSATEIPRLQSGIEEEALERLARWIPAADQEGLGLTLGIVTGAAEEEIVRYAAAEKPDLLVLGAGEGDVRDTLADLAARVVRGSSCAVLVAA